MAFRDNDITMENVEIRIRNFAGKPDALNPNGKRTFLLLLTPVDAEMFSKKGFNVKQFKLREGDEVAQDFLKVTVKMDGDFPPKVVMVTERNKTKLDADTVMLLDTADIINIDLIISPYVYDMTKSGGGAGISAYLRSGYFTINEDDLDKKYGDIPDNAETNMALQSLYADDDDL